MVWTGEEGVRLGVVDAFGSDDYVAKEIIGVEHKVDFTQPDRLLDRIAGKLGASFGQAIGSMAQGISLQ